MVKLGKPQVLTKVSDRTIYLQWVDRPFKTPDNKDMPIAVSSHTVYMVWNHLLQYVNPNVINFVLWHEIGHIVLGHYKNGGPRNIDEENAADAFALSKLEGQKLFSKEDVADFCRWFGSICGKLEKVTDEYIESQYKRFGL